MVHANSFCLNLSPSTSSETPSGIQVEAIHIISSRTSHYLLSKHLSGSSMPPVPATMAVTKLLALFSTALFLSQGHAAPTFAANLTTRDIPRGVIIEHCTVPGVVALTFDDGPFIYTNHILDLLDEYCAKATFFINGENWSRGLSDFSTPWPET